MKAKIVKRALDVACLGLSTSVFLDSLLWVKTSYMIPCWTMAVVSGGFIALIQVLKGVLE